MFYLLYITSVSRTDCTNVFYATIRTKLDPTCICFNDICELVVAYVTFL